MKRYRVFSGKRYELVGMAMTSRDAQRAKDDIKSMGRSVRVIGSKKQGYPSYSVYASW